MHDRETIPELTTRHVIGHLLASGQVARMNAGWLVPRPPGSRPTRQRFWGTVRQDGEAAYLVLFLTVDGADYRGIDRTRIRTGMVPSEMASSS